MRRGAAAAAVAACLLATALTAPAASASGSEIAAVRAATAQYHRLVVAEDAGYEEFLPCIDAPGIGGMGQHYVDMKALDGTVEATHPEALVYEPRGNRMRLVGVEYVVPQAAWQGSEPPQLFGEEFHRNDTLGIWALHAWIWRHNPDGMHADFNPKVSLC